MLKVRLLHLGRLLLLSTDVLLFLLQVCYRLLQVAVPIFQILRTPNGDTLSQWQNKNDKDTTDFFELFPFFFFRLSEDVINEYILNDFY